MGIFEMDDVEYSSIYAEEAAMVDAAELIANGLERNGMTNSELAAALGIGEVEVTGYLVGDPRMTVRQLAKTLHALGERLELKSSSPD